MIFILLIIQDLYIFTGAMCCYSLLYTDSPGCIGCSAKGEALCLESQFCLKQGAEQFPIGFSTPDGAICQISLPCCQKILKVPTTCCKGGGQTCCMVTKGALPPDAEIPMVCGVCFLALYPVVGFMKKLGEVKSG